MEELIITEENKIKVNFMYAIRRIFDLHGIKRCHDFDFKLAYMDVMIQHHDTLKKLDD